LESYSSVVFNSEDYSPNVTISYQNYKDVLLSRNSGSLFLLENMKKIGWHNDNYFVDGVDYEYNLRSKISGYKIAEFSMTPGFDHISEQGDKKCKIFGKVYLVRLYSSSRIIDTVKSSVKLIIKSILQLEIQFALKYFRLLLVYILSQLLARIQHGDLS